MLKATAEGVADALGGAGDLGLPLRVPSPLGLPLRDASPLGEAGVAGLLEEAPRIGGFAC